MGWVAETTDVHFSQFWKLERQDQGARRLHFWQELLPGLQSHLPSGSSRGGEPEHSLPLSLLVKPLITSQSPHLQIQSYWGLKF